MPGATPGEGGREGKAIGERGQHSLPAEGRLGLSPGCGGCAEGSSSALSHPPSPAPGCGVSRPSSGRGRAFLRGALGPAARWARRGPLFPLTRDRRLRGRVPRPRPVAGSGDCRVWGGGGGLWPLPITPASPSCVPLLMRPSSCGRYLQLLGVPPVPACRRGPAVSLDPRSPTPALPWVSFPTSRFYPLSLRPPPIPAPVLSRGDLEETVEINC